MWLLEGEVFHQKKQLVQCRNMLEVLQEQRMCSDAGMEWTRGRVVDHDITELFGKQIMMVLEVILRALASTLWDGEPLASLVWVRMQEWGFRDWFRCHSNNLHKDASTWAAVVVVEGLRSGQILDLKVEPTERPCWIACGTEEVEEWRILDRAARGMKLWSFFS